MSETWLPGIEIRDYSASNESSIIGGNGCQHACSALFVIYIPSNERHYLPSIDRSQVKMKVVPAADNLAGNLGDCGNKAMISETADTGALSDTSYL